MSDTTQNRDVLEVKQDPKSKYFGAERKEGYGWGKYEFKVNFLTKGKRQLVRFFKFEQDYYRSTEGRICFMFIEWSQSSNGSRKNTGQGFCTVDIKSLFVDGKELKDEVLFKLLMNGEHK